jgi:hypothetical protein
MRTADKCIFAPWQAVELTAPVSCSGSLKGSPMKLLHLLERPITTVGVGVE